MKTEMIITMGGYDFTLYNAASGDWCVSVESYNEREDYNVGTREEALEFIIRYAADDIEEN